jgi:hypothetical protein
MLKNALVTKINGALEKNVHVVQQLFTNIQKMFIILQKCSISKGSPIPKKKFIHFKKCAIMYVHSQIKFENPWQRTGICTSNSKDFISSVYLLHKSRPSKSRIHG